MIYKPWAWFSRRLASASLSKSLRSGESSKDRRILIVDELLPDPMLGAGYPRANQIVSTLVDLGFEVEHLPLASSRAQRSRVDVMFSGKVRFHRGKGPRGLRAVLSRSGDSYEALFVSRPATMKALQNVGWEQQWGARRPPVIYDAEALFAVREKRRRALYPPELSEENYRKELAAEIRLMSSADAIATASPSDAAVIRSEIGIPTFVLAHSIPARDSRSGSFGHRRDILFVGRLTGSCEQSPNVDSIRYFVTEIMPALDRLIGSDYVLRLAGIVHSPDIEALRSDRVIVLGPVDDLRDLYDQCRLFVAPTRFSAGIPLKVTEAMSRGLPCVVTQQLAEQLEARDPTVVIGDDTHTFAQACARLYTDADEWLNTRDAALAYVSDAFSPATFRERLVEIVDAANAYAATTRRYRR